MWVGGLTELLKVAATAASYDVPVGPHAAGPYSYHFVVAHHNAPFQEYLANSPDGKNVERVFGDLFEDEVMPSDGRVEVSRLDRPGFGLDVSATGWKRLIEGTRLLEVMHEPQKALTTKDEHPAGAKDVNGAF